MKKIVVGLTGGVCSGKTTVLNEFKKYGFKTHNADEISKKVFYKPKILEKIKKIFGTADRKKIAMLIFSAAKKRKQLERIIHPLVIEEIKNFSASTRRSPLVVVEAPLLFEKKLKKLFNMTVTVWTTKEHQIARLGKQGIKKRDAVRRISSQMPLYFKRKLSDKVILNVAGLGDLRKQVKKIVEEIKSNH